MCGFAGILNLDGRPVEAQVLKQMSASLVHRGPDDEGHVLLSPDRPALEFGDPAELRDRGAAPHALGLAFRRLSIIDVSRAGHQPMCNEDGTVWIVFNGEFYNSLEFTDDLSARGHRFKSNTDTEVILHLYEEFGLDGALERMNGMFAFALCDLRARRLFLARDRVGVKPLYYAETRHSVAFASEVKALFRAPEVSRALDRDRLGELLQNRYVNSPNTLFSGIQKLEPGSWLSFRLDASGAERRRYWSLFGCMREKAEATAADYRQALVRAVDLRLRSDVPLGVFLSGGLDSSSITAVVRRELGRELQTFSIEFGEDSGVSEAWASRAVSDHFGTEHHGIRFDPDVLETLPRIARHIEEPIADPALLPTWFLCEFTRRHVTVALSGEGSDETNYGYGTYALGHPGALLRALPALLERPALGVLARLRGGPMARLARFIDEPSGEHDAEEFLPPDLIARVLGSEVPNASRGSWWKDRWRARSVFDARPLIHFHTWLVDDLLLTVDKMSMAHSLEVRVPFLDPDVLVISANLSARRKLAGGQTKAVLRRVAQEWLPDSIRQRQQHGFLVPLADVFERDLARGAESSLRAYLEPAAGLIDVESALTALAPDGRVDAASATRLWLLALLGLSVTELGLALP